MSPDDSPSARRARDPLSRSQGHGSRMPASVFRKRRVRSARTRPADERRATRAPRGGKTSRAQEDRAGGGLLCTRGSLYPHSSTPMTRSSDSTGVPQCAAGHRQHERLNEHGGIDARELQISRTVVGTSTDLAIEGNDVRQRRRQGIRATNRVVRSLQRWRRCNRAGTAVVAETGGHRHRGTHEGPEREHNAREHPSAYSGTLHRRGVLWIGYPLRRKSHRSSPR